MENKKQEIICVLPDTHQNDQNYLPYTNSKKQEFKVYPVESQNDTSHQTGNKIWFNMHIPTHPIRFKSTHILEFVA